MGTCSNATCCQGIESDAIPDVLDSKTMFDMRVNISDYTGTLESCNLGGQAAEHMFQCTVCKFNLIILLDIQYMVLIGFF